MINPQCDETETDLPVDTANRPVLHAVEKKHEQCHNPGYKDQCRHNGQNLRIHALQGLEPPHPFLPVEMQPYVPDYGGCHKKRYDHVSIGRLLIEFTNCPVGAGLNALVTADAVGRIFCNGVLVDAQDVYLAQDALRAGLYALPTGLADMGIDEDMLRLVIRRALGMVSFHERKGTDRPCV